MAIAYAFLKRDLSIALSYRLSFLFQFLGLFLSVASFYFLSRLVSDSVTGYLDIYGGEYFPFALLGLAFTTYMTLGMATFSDQIRHGQMMGTLEMMLLSPTKLSVILLSSSLWAYVFGSLRVFIILLIGMAFFGVSFNQANLLAGVVTLILSVLSFSSIGMISAAFVMVLKKGDPISWVFGGLSALVSGVLYPVTVLPDWLQHVSAILPLTYSLNAARLAILQGYSLSQLRFDVLALVGFSVGLMPIALLSFRLAVKRAKVEGSLVQY
jgi:ABC-2 type transport system permease protein